MVDRIVLEELEVPSSVTAPARSQLVFEGVDQGGPSFEGRVFVDNPNADRNTPASASHGYVGSFHVYGYGVFPETDGPAPDEAAPRRPGDAPRAPITKAVPLHGGDVVAGRRMIVTLVALPYGGAPAGDPGIDLTHVRARVEPGPF